jgi:hypothetical protein
MEFNLTKILASALASITAAVAASRFGIDGTLIGAGLMSIIASVSTAFYSTTMKSTHAVAKKKLGREDQAADGEAAATPAEGTADDTPGGEDAPAPAPSPVDPSPRSRLAWIKWERVAAAAVLIFVVSMGVITAVEALAKEPVSVLVGAERTGARTSIGGAFSSDDQDTSTPSDSSTSSTTPDGYQTEPTETTVAPSTTVPESTGDEQQLAPSTVAPSTAPAETGGDDRGGGAQTP